MINTLIALLFIIITTAHASKFLHPFYSYHQEENEAYNDQPDDKNLLIKSYMKLKTQTKNDWEDREDPKLYFLSSRKNSHNEIKQFLSQDNPRLKKKGPSGPSLSIVNPLEVLQEKWLLELNRRQKAASLGQIQKNRQILSTIGKRRYSGSSFDEAMDGKYENQLDGNNSKFFRFIYYT